MWKKVLTGFFICSALLTVNSEVYATDGTNSNVNNSKNEITIEKKEVKLEATDLLKYQITSPEEKLFTSRDKFAFINGKAPTGTIISIRVYGTTDLTRKVFNLSRLPKAEDYIEIHEEDIEVGNMGFFDKQLELVTGINRILISFNVEGVPSEEIIIFVEPKLTRVNRDIKLTDIMTLMR